MSRADLPVGVFDSGIGGLTVLRALVESLPTEQFIYLGDTARLPYGTKTAATVERYALQAADLLIERGVKCLVVACNTASAAALPAMLARYTGVIVVGVVEPGAAAACAVTRNDHVGVIATEGTVQGGAYQRAIAKRRPELRVTARPAQLLVALAEEGWAQEDIAAMAARRYLQPMFGADSPDTLVLGCTHFPLLGAAIRAAVGPDVAIVDSAATTAAFCRTALRDVGLISERAEGSVTFLATDGVERFARVGSTFLGRRISAADVERVDLRAT